MERLVTLTEREAVGSVCAGIAVLTSHVSKAVALASLLVTGTVARALDGALAC